MSWRAREVNRTSHKNSGKFWVALSHIAGKFVRRGPGSTGSCGERKRTISLCGFDFCAGGKAHRLKSVPRKPACGCWRSFREKNEHDCCRRCGVLPGQHWLGAIECERRGPAL